MPSSAEVQLLRAAQAEISGLVTAELQDLLASLGGAGPDAVRDALLDVVPELVAQYGDVAATASAEWFEQVYGSRATLAQPMARTNIERGVRYTAAHLWTPEPDAIAGVLATKLDGWVKQPGRDTLARAADRHGMRWARVPQGPRTCAFCLVMASRDAVYLTERSASKSRDGSKYHGLCDCVAIPMNGWDDYPEDYDPQGLYDIYNDAANAAGTRSDIKSVAAEIRRRNPDLVTDAVIEAQ